MTPTDIPGDDQQFIIEKAVDGFTPGEISYLLELENESRITADTVEEFMETEVAEERIELQKSIQEKQAQVSREELVADLKEAKEGLKAEVEQLRENNLSEISNESVSNLISNIKLLGEFIGELQQKDSSSGGTVNVNKLEQNFNIVQSIQYMTPEDKQDVVEQLKDDDDIEDFVIKRKA